MSTSTETSGPQPHVTFRAEVEHAGQAEAAACTVAEAVVAVPVISADVAEPAAAVVNGAAAAITVVTEDSVSLTIRSRRSKRNRFIEPPALFFFGQVGLFSGFQTGRAGQAVELLRFRISPRLELTSNDYDFLRLQAFYGLCPWQVLQSVEATVPLWQAKQLSSRS